MHRQIALNLRIASSLLILSGYLALAAVNDYGNVMLLIPAVLISMSPMGEYLDRRHKGYRSFTTALTIAFACFNVPIFQTVGPVDWVVILVMYIQGYLMIHRKSERFYLYMFMMAFFMVLAACVQAPEPHIALVLALFMLSGIWSFLSLRLFIDSARNESPAEADIVPLHVSNAAAAHFEQRRNKLGIATPVALLTFASLLMTAMLFYLTPRIEAGFLARNNAVPAVTGMSQTVDLTGGKFVQEDQTAMMHVRYPDSVDGRHPASGGMYWRTTTMPYYENATWSRRGLREHLEPDIDPMFSRIDFNNDHDNPLEVARTGRPAYPLVRQLVYMDDVPDEGVPCLDLVQKLEVVDRGKNTGISWDGKRDFTVKLSKTGPRRLTYEAWSEIGDPSSNELRAVSQNYDYMHPRDFELLTYHELLPETQELARTLTADRPTLYDKVIAIREHLSGTDYFYTLNVPALPPDAPIDAFISEFKRGHCELFSSAMTLMLRSLGIPARVVLGYRGGEWDEADEAYTVRASMTHLWVEVLFPEYGWVRFDPSPSGSLDDLSGIGWIARTLSGYMLRMKMLWYQEIIGFDRGVQLERLRDLSLGLFQNFLLDTDAETANARNAIASGAARRTQLLAPIALVIVLTAGAIVWWRGRERRRAARRLTPDQRRAVQLFGAMRQHLRRWGIRCEGKATEELTPELTRFEELREGVVPEIIRAYNAARFGRRGLDPGAYSALLRKLRALRPRPS